MFETVLPGLSDDFMNLLEGTEDNHARSVLSALFRLFSQHARAEVKAALPAILIAPFSILPSFHQLVRDAQKSPDIMKCFWIMPSKPASEVIMQLIKI